MPRPARRTTIAPAFDQIILGDLRPADASELSDGTVIDGLQFDEITVDEWRVDARTGLESSLFRGVVADRWEIRGAKVAETIVERGDFTTTSGGRARMRDVEVRDSRFGAAELFGSKLNSVRFTRCKLGYVNLRATELTNVAFVDCTIEDLDLMEAVADRVALSGSRIGALHLTGSTLTNVDLRGADLTEIVGLDHLRGATISTDQLMALAPAMATGMGIRVED
ncbi:pentapeptide repeat-containing protein [Nocardioides marmoriginsengisoli]|uniref:Pentapeptide repeat-containing protein n=1 Tax=Nocardioides marmoriginsengisoli TaxID=661483 RepID=A0A3N0CAJ7_9ACTN|nr:pentapeptide repeat-containing protein [Nocardioides marmoriginsengisoli]RNL60485.1 pentapeptide repeat-containing protein [Nocardioides marmoriginsengisoli]